MKKVKKSKGSSHPSNFVPSPNKAPIVKAEVKIRAPLVLGGTTPAGLGKALEERAEGPVTTVKA